jgi:hypothetical protein
MKLAHGILAALLTAAAPAAAQFDGACVDRREMRCGAA